MNNYPLLLILVFIFISHLSVIAIWKDEALNAITDIVLDNLSKQALLEVQHHIGEHNAYTPLYKSVIELNQNKLNKPWFDVNKHNLIRTLRPFKLQDCGAERKCAVYGLQSAVRYLLGNGDVMELVLSPGNIQFKSPNEAIAYLVQFVSHLTNPVHSSGFGKRTIKNANGMTLDEFWNQQVYTKSVSAHGISLSWKSYLRQEARVVREQRLTSKKQCPLEKIVECGVNWAFKSSSVAVIEFLKASTTPRVSNDNELVDAYNTQIVQAGLRAAELLSQIYSDDACDDRDESPNNSVSPYVPAIRPYQRTRKRDKFKAMILMKHVDRHTGLAAVVRKRKLTCSFQLERDPMGIINISNYNYKKTRIGIGLQGDRSQYPMYLESILKHAPEAVVFQNGRKYIPQIVMNTQPSQTLDICCTAPSPNLVLHASVQTDWKRSTIDTIYVVGQSDTGIMDRSIPEDEYRPEYDNILVAVAVDPNHELLDPTVKCGRASAFCVSVVAASGGEAASTLTSVVALLMETVPYKPASQYVNAILRSADPIYDGGVKHPAGTGVGLLNANRALLFLKNPLLFLEDIVGKGYTMIA